MFIDDIIQEQKEINRQWAKQREKGFKNYLIIGSIKSFLLIGSAFLINAVIEKSFHNTNIFAAITASIIIPLVSWIVNEVSF